MKDHQGRPLHIEVNYTHKDLEYWKVAIMLPSQQSFLLIDLPVDTTVHFKMRAIGFNSVFGPETNFSVKTRSKLHQGIYNALYSKLDKKLIIRHTCAMFTYYYTVNKN